MVQGELFREEHAGIASEAKPRSFLARYQISVSLDKVLIACVGLVVVFALVFSFGVEKGKRAMEQKLETFLPDTKQPALTVSASHLSADPQEEVIAITAGQEDFSAPELPSSTPPPAEINLLPKAVLPLVDQTKAGAYTIQLVTYASEAQALKEIERLKTQGFSSFVIPSGRYFQVCVNYFESKDVAKSTFKRLREDGRYPGAFVRPVVR